MTAHRPPGRVGIYALWQFRDYLLDRGAPTLIVSFLGGYLTAAPMMPGLKRSMETLPPRLIERWGGVEQAKAVMMGDFNAMFLRSFLGSIVFLGALFAMNGIVANDRKQGFYRFLFAKPITPSRYYGQAFLVHWVGFVGIASGLALLYGAMVWPIMSLRLMTAITLMYVLYAGIAFALSAAARWDWLSLVAVTVAASYLWGRYAESESVFAKLLYLLPPLHRTAEVYTAAATSEPIPWPLLQWFTAYGIVCYVIGLIVLRYRRLAIV